MRIYNPLRLRKIFRDHLGISRINQRIYELFAEKVDYEDYKRTQKLLDEITECAFHVDSDAAAFSSTRVVAAKNSADTKSR